MYMISPLEDISIPRIELSVSTHHYLGTNPFGEGSSRGRARFLQEKILSSYFS